MSYWHFNSQNKRPTTSPFRRTLPNHKGQKTDKDSRSRSREKENSLSNYRAALKNKVGNSKKVVRQSRRDDYEMIRHNEMFPKRKIIRNQPQEKEGLRDSTTRRRSPSLKENSSTLIEIDQDKNSIINVKENTDKSVKVDSPMTSLLKEIDNLKSEDNSCSSQETYSTTFSPEKNLFVYLQGLAMNSAPNHSDEENKFSNHHNIYKTLNFNDMESTPGKNSVLSKMSNEKDNTIVEDNNFIEDEYELQIVIECYDELYDNNNIGLANVEVEYFPSKIKTEETLQNNNNSNNMEIEEEATRKNIIDNIISDKELLVETVEESEDNKRLNLVLDLDETLVNCYSVCRQDRLREMGTNLPTNFQEFLCDGFCIRMIIRPYLMEFLERVSKHYDIYLYSFGMYRYVCAVLDIIDKEEKYIKRSRVFETKPNEKRVQKQLSNLKFSEKQKERTLIIDDFCNIWLEDEKVICSKKFIPFKNFLNKDTYCNYPITISKTVDKEKKQVKEIRWLSHNNKISDLKYYSETGLGTKKPSQLESLADFLDDIAEEYQEKGCFDKSLTLDKLFYKRRKEILEGLKIKILSGSFERQKTFEEMALLLGAQNVDADNAEYILVDSYLDSMARVRLQEDLIGKKIKMLSIYWLVECLFLLKKVRLQDFYANSSLKEEFK